MPRKKRTAAAAAEATPDAATVTTAATPEPPPVAEPPQEAAKAAPPPPAYAPDPNPTMSVSLSTYSGGPSMHLLRSRKFNQMQIRFEGEQPGERHLARLHELGWKDRSESEGVWTKQIDRAGRWQSVRRMEQEFREVANAIRQEKGLEPSQIGMALA